MPDLTPQVIETIRNQKNLDLNNSDDLQEATVAAMRKIVPGFNKHSSEKAFQLADEWLNKREVRGGLRLEDIRATGAKEQADKYLSMAFDYAIPTAVGVGTEMLTKSPQMASMASAGAVGVGEATKRILSRVLAGRGEGEQVLKGASDPAAQPFVGDPKMSFMQDAGNVVADTLVSYAVDRFVPPLLGKLWTGTKAGMKGFIQPDSVQPNVQQAQRYLEDRGSSLDLDQWNAGDRNFATFMGATARAGYGSGHLMGKGDRARQAIAQGEADTYIQNYSRTMTPYNWGTTLKQWMKGEIDYVKGLRTKYFNDFRDTLTPDQMTDMQPLYDFFKKEYTEQGKPATAKAIAKVGEILNIPVSEFKPQNKVTGKFDKSATTETFDPATGASVGTYQVDTEGTTSKVGRTVDKNTTTTRPNSTTTTISTQEGEYELPRFVPTEKAANIYHNLNTLYDATDPSVRRAGTLSAKEVGAAIDQSLVANADGLQKWRYANKFYGETADRLQNDLVDNALRRLENKPSTVAAIFEGEGHEDTLRRTLQAFTKGRKIESNLNKEEAERIILEPLRWDILSKGIDPDTKLLKGNLLDAALNQRSEGFNKIVFGENYKLIKEWANMLKINEARPPGGDAMWIRMAQGGQLTSAGLSLGYGYAADSSVAKTMAGGIAAVMLLPIAFAKIIKSPKMLQLAKSATEQGIKSKAFAQFMSTAMVQNEEAQKEIFKMSEDSLKFFGILPKAQPGDTVQVNQPQQALTR